MIGLGGGSLKVYLALEPCDMRKSFNGLYEIACGELGGDPKSKEALFAFTNKRRNRLKLLYFDGTGLWVAAKRLEEGTFSWPKPSEKEQKKMRLANEALQLIIDGVDMRGAQFKPWYERSECEEES